MLTSNSATAATTAAGSSSFAGVPDQTWPVNQYGSGTDLLSSDEQAEVTEPTVSKNQKTKSGKKVSPADEARAWLSAEMRRRCLTKRGVENSNPVYSKITSSDGTPLFPGIKSAQDLSYPDDFNLLRSWFNARYPEDGVVVEAAVATATRTHDWIRKCALSDIAIDFFTAYRYDRGPVETVLQMKPKVKKMLAEQYQDYRKDRWNIDITYRSASNLVGIWRRKILNAGYMIGSTVVSVVQQQQPRNVDDESSVSNDIADVYDNKEDDDESTTTTTTTDKTTSTSRLAREREMATLRQRKCRERKRQALLENKGGKAITASATPPSPPPTTATVAVTVTAAAAATTVATPGDVDGDDEGKTTKQVSKQVSKKARLETPASSNNDDDGVITSASTSALQRRRRKRSATTLNQSANDGTSAAIASTADGMGGPNKKQKQHNNTHREKTSTAPVEEEPRKATCVQTDHTTTTRVPGSKSLSTLPQAVTSTASAPSLKTKKKRVTQATFPPTRSRGGGGNDEALTAAVTLMQIQSSVGKTEASSDGGDDDDDDNPRRSNDNDQEEDDNDDQQDDRGADDNNASGRGGGANDNNNVAAATTTTAARATITTSRRSSLRISASSTTTTQQSLSASSTAVTSQQSSSSSSSATISTSSVKDIKRIITNNKKLFKEIRGTVKAIDENDLPEIPSNYDNNEDNNISCRQNNGKWHVSFASLLAKSYFYHKQVNVSKSGYIGSYRDKTSALRYALRIKQLALDKMVMFVDTRFITTASTKVVYDRRVMMAKERRKIIATNDSKINQEARNRQDEHDKSKISGGRCRLLPVVERNIRPKYVNTNGVVTDFDMDPMTGAKLPFGIILDYDLSIGGSYGWYPRVLKFEEWRAVEGNPSYNNIESSLAYHQFLRDLEFKSYQQARLSFRQSILNKIDFVDYMVESHKQQKLPICCGPQRDGSEECPKLKHLTELFKEAENNDENDNSCIHNYHRHRFVSSSLQVDHNEQRMEKLEEEEKMKFIDSTSLRTLLYNKKRLDSQCLELRCFGCHILVTLEDKNRSIRYNKAWRQLKLEQFKKQDFKCYGPMGFDVGKSACPHQTHLSNQWNACGNLEDKEEFCVYELIFDHRTSRMEDADGVRMSLADEQLCKFRNAIHPIENDPGFVRCYSCNHEATRHLLRKYLRTKTDHLRFYDYYDFMSVCHGFPCDYERPRIVVNYALEARYGTGTRIKIKHRIVETDEDEWFLATIQEYENRTVTYLDDLTKCFAVHRILYDGDPTELRDVVFKTNNRLSYAEIDFDRESPNYKELGWNDVEYKLVE